jgi:selenocysteine lyase/cysteine desulfurase
MGVLFAKHEHLTRLQPYKIAANTHAIPLSWEWGTLNHECIAGIIACVDYLAELGRRIDPAASTRRERLLTAWRVIQRHERVLIERLIAGLLQMPCLTLYGISDPERFDARCPTVAIRIAGHTPLQLATSLGHRGFFTWDGNYYALNLTEHFDVEKDGGFLRIGLAHYNTAEEVDRFLRALREITDSLS